MKKELQDRDLLNDPSFQLNIVRNAERWLGLDRLLRQPAVIFERTMDSFWATAENSSNKDAYLNRVRSGELIPVNADLLGDISSNHSMLHVYLAESGMGIPTIPTTVNLTFPNGPKLGPVTSGKYELKGSIPGVYVVKKSRKDGKMTSHGAKGVDVVKITSDNMQQYLPKDIFEFIQPFVVPPDSYVRDIRVYLVGGVPTAGLIRRAQEPLKKENLSGEIIPSPSQYPSAKNPGPKEPLEGDLRKKILENASKIAQFLDKKVRGRKRPFSQYSTFGFGSIDFILDKDGTPLPVDFDLGPSVRDFEGINRTLGKKMAELLRKLAIVGNLDREIWIIGQRDDPLVTATIKEAEALMFKSKIVFKEAPEIQALKEETPKTEPKISEIKLGRNEPCWCGSGRKYKRCHLQ